MNMLKNMLLTGAGLLAIASAWAADAEYATTGTKGQYLISRGYTNTTTVKFEDLEVQDNRYNVYVNYVCGTTVTATIVTKTADGQTLASQTITCGTTPGQVSFAAPLYFEKVGVSPTTTVSATNGVTSTIIRTK